MKRIAATGIAIVLLLIGSQAWADPSNCTKYGYKVLETNSNICNVNGDNMPVDQVPVYVQKCKESPDPPGCRSEFIQAVNADSHVGPDLPSGCSALPTGNQLSCDTATSLAMGACELNPFVSSSTLDAQTASKAVQGTGMTGGDLLTMLGSMGSSAAMMASGPDVKTQCETAAKIAKNMRNLEALYASACTAAMTLCVSMCSTRADGMDSAVKAVQQLKEGKVDPKYKECKLPDDNKYTYASWQNSYQRAKSSLNTRATKCGSYLRLVSQAAQQAISYESQIAQATNCANLASATNCTGPNAASDPNCLQTCANATYAASHPECQPLVSACTGANATSAACVCQNNPTDPMCTGRPSTNPFGSTPNGLANTDALTNTGGIGDIKPGNNANGIGNVSAGTPPSGSGPQKSPGSPTAANRPGGAPPAGIDSNVDHGFRPGGGYSVSGVPLTGGGGGGLNPNDRFDMNKYLPKGQGKDAFRSLAGMQTTGADGITCANCTDIWTKVAIQYGKQRSQLRP